MKNRIVSLKILKLLKIIPNQSAQSPPPDFPLPLLIFIIVFGGIIIGLLAYITYKKISAQRRTKIENFLSKCTDISNIKAIFVIDIKSGIPVFFQSFGSVISNPNSEVMQTKFVNLELIIILREKPSINFKFIMEDLAYDIYKHYGTAIDNFTGDLEPFEKMKELIEKHLHVSFLSTLNIEENHKGKLSEAEKEMVDKARTFMKENNFKYFYKNNGDDRFPHPYIFTHPRPPDDFAGASQVQFRAHSKEKDSEDEINCQYCGMKLTKEEQFTHSCKKKPE